MTILQTFIKNPRLPQLVHISLGFLVDILRERSVLSFSSTAENTENGREPRLNNEIFSYLTHLSLEPDRM